MIPTFIKLNDKKYLAFNLSPKFPLTYKPTAYPNINKKLILPIIS